MTNYRALLITKSDAGQQVAWGEMTDRDLMPGDVTIRVTHTTMNYKDGLAITGRSPVVRRFPMVPGIDSVGTVIQSDTSAFKIGDVVILNGHGTGETHLGAYAEVQRIKGDWLVPKPHDLTAEQAAAIGTAGYTAMLSVMALEKNGVVPANGPVLVTGAAGGVGSVAIALLSRLGFTVSASTGRPEEAAYLKALGASEIIDRSEFSGTPRPLAKERFAGAIDTVGSITLANVLAAIRYGGTVAACGLAQGMDLPASVAPFILRGITLAGIDSVMAPKAKRLEAWSRLSRDLDRDKLAAMTVRRPIGDVIALAPQILAGKVRGRLVFEMK